uniref:Integrin alpha-2 domain-containing protein n=1 Tax=Chrysemys picta bellii TaxID=8478 RepID=A0A8C3FNH0_CHRPI
AGAGDRSGAKLSRGGNPSPQHKARVSPGGAWSGASLCHPSAPFATRKDDILVGAPLYMEQHSDRKLYEVGCIYLYLQRRGPHPYRHPWQTMTGTEVYGRFGTAIAPAGDLDQDGYVDVAVGAPFVGSGRVLIFRGYSEGLRTPASQVLESPFPGRAAFGFSVRGATDIDSNGYPGTAILTATPAQPVVVASSQLLVPDVLNPEEKTCTHHTPVPPGTPQPTGETEARVGGTEILPNIPIWSRLCPGGSGWARAAALGPSGKGSQCARAETCGTGGAGTQPCLITLLSPPPQDEADFKDKLSPIVVSLALTLAAGPGTEELGLVLYGQTVVQEQTRIVLDCGEDNVCIPKLQLAAHTAWGDSLFIGAENVVHILADATNAGEGAFEAELRLQLPRDAHYQKATSNVQGLEKLICNLKKENETRVVICELGNPMKSGTKVGAFPPPPCAASGLPFPWVRGPWQDMPVLSSSWIQPPNSCLPPSSRCLPPAWRPPHSHPALPPLSSPPIPKLHNQGPGTVSQAELRVEFPNQFQGDFLLYMMKLNTEGRINCSSPTGLNPLGVGAGICCTGRGWGAATRPWAPGSASSSTSRKAPRCHPSSAARHLSLHEQERELGAAQAPRGPREGVMGEMEHVVRVHLPGSDVGSSQVPAGKAAPVPLSQPAASLWG